MVCQKQWKCYIILDATRLDNVKNIAVAVAVDPNFEVLESHMREILFLIIIKIHVCC